MSASKTLIDMSVLIEGLSSSIDLMDSLAIDCKNCNIPINTMEDLEVVISSTEPYFHSKRGNRRSISINTLEVGLKKCKFHLGVEDDYI